MIPCDVVILCGGRGERLGNLTQTTPKPLLKIGNDPFLLHLLSRFQHEGFERFILAARYLAPQFQDFLETQADRFPGMRLILEREPLGTGGALRHAVPHVKSRDFIAVNGDAFLNQPLCSVLDFHRRNKGLFTLVAVRSDNVEGETANKGGLEIGPEGKLLGFRGHKRVRETWINGGFYAVNREILSRWPEGSYSLEERLLSLMEPDPVQVFRSGASLLDIGTPASYEIAMRKYETHSLSFG